MRFGLVPCWNQASLITTFKHLNGFKESAGQAVTTRGSGKSTSGECSLWGNQRSLNGKVVAGNAGKSWIDKRVFLSANLFKLVLKIKPIKFGYSHPTSVPHYQYFLAYHQGRYVAPPKYPRRLVLVPVGSEWPEVPKPGYTYARMPNLQRYLNETLAHYYEDMIRTYQLGCHNGLLRGSWFFIVWVILASKVSCLSIHPTNISLPLLQFSGLPPLLHRSPTVPECTQVWCKDWGLEILKT